MNGPDALSGIEESLRRVPVGYLDMQEGIPVVLPGSEADLLISGPKFYPTASITRPELPTFHRPMTYDPELHELGCAYVNDAGDCDCGVPELMVRVHHELDLLPLAVVRDNYPALHELFDRTTPPPTTTT